MDPFLLNVLIAIACPGWFCILIFPIFKFFSSFSIFPLPFLGFVSVCFCLFLVLASTLVLELLTCYSSRWKSSRLVRSCVFSSILNVIPPSIFSSAFLFTPSPRSNNSTQHSILSTSPPLLMYRVLQIVFLTKLV